MPDEASKFNAVCRFCFHSEAAAAVEFNFRDEAIYYVCPKCKKPNKMSMKPISAQPYPKARLAR
jgi:hypothetical protein